MSESRRNGSISLLGDILIHDHLGKKSNPVLDVLTESDLVLGNLETTLATKGYPAAKLFKLCAKHSVVEDFKRMGMKSMAFANNHAMDFGPEGLYETLGVLRSHGIPLVGAGRNLTEALKPTILKLGKLRAAFFACSCLIPSDAIATNDRPGLVPIRVNTSININARQHQESVGGIPTIKTSAEEKDLNRLVDILKHTKDQSDIIIVSIHWGQVLHPLVLDYQEQIAHDLINNGADIIMGHGSHILNGIETYKGKLVFYGLGDFIHHLSPDYRRNLTQSAILQRAFGNPHRWRFYEGAIGKVVLNGSKIKRAEITPIALDQKGSPTICDAETGGAILSYLAVLSRYSRTSLITKENKGIVTV